MKITNISLQTRNLDRVDISVDGVYKFSLDITQIGELGVKIGKEYTEAELIEIEIESQFGKLYSRTLEYCLVRPRSEREVSDYLWRKTRTTKYKDRKGKIKEREAISQHVGDRVLTRLLERGYINDEKFARWWIENRNLRKGSSRRKLESELRNKGVISETVTSVMQESERNDANELKKIIAKKSRRYTDKQKLIQYLVGQGFSYDDVRHQLDSSD